MSFENRSEDVDLILKMNIGDSFEFNVFQEGGAEVRRIPDNDVKTYELYELKMYSGIPMLDREFSESQIESVINEVYDTWT